MGRIARLEERIAQLENALAEMTFVSNAQTVQVMIPVPELDANGNPTGNVLPGYLPIKTGPTSGKIKLGKNSSTLVVQ